MSSSALATERFWQHSLGSLMRNRSLRVYILFAHPAPRSFCRHILEALCRGLIEAGHAYEVLDHYAPGFTTDREQ
jgi:hypothetical protein